MSCFQLFFCPFSPPSWIVFCSIQTGFLSGQNQLLLCMCLCLSMFLCVNATMDKSNNESIFLSSNFSIEFVGCWAAKLIWSIANLLLLEKYSIKRDIAKDCQKGERERIRVQMERLLNQLRFFEALEPIEVVSYVYHPVSIHFILLPLYLMDYDVML